MTTPFCFLFFFFFSFSSACAARGKRKRGWSIKEGKKKEKRDDAGTLDIQRAPPMMCPVTIDRPVRTPPLKVRVSLDFFRSLPLHRGKMVEVRQGESSFSWIRVEIRYRLESKGFSSGYSDSSSSG